jgi:peptidyl-prolyl cis-trans isomerase D
VARQFQLFELLGDLVGDARSEQTAHENFVFGTYVLRYEADALGIAAADEEIVEAIKKIPAFQTNGAFDPQKYTLATKNLGSQGFGTDVVEELMRDNLRLQRLKELAATTIAAPPNEVREMFAKSNQKNEVSFVRLKEEDFAKEIQVSDDDAKKAFEERKETFKTDERRKVKFVAFKLTEEENKLTGKDRAAALQKLLDRTSEFTVEMAQKDAKLDEVAKKFAATVAETPEFPRASPPAELGNSSNAADAAFDKLTMEQPNSDAIVNDQRDGYFVLQLAGITPPRPQTFDEVKAKLMETLKNERTSEAIAKKATEIRTQLETEIKGGKSFADAAKAAGLVAETLPAFSPREPAKTEVVGAQEIMQAAPELTEGQLSEALPVPSGRIIFRVEKRLPIDEAAFEKEKASLADRFSSFQARGAFQLWLAERRKAANVQVGGES